MLLLSPWSIMIFLFIILLVKIESDFETFVFTQDESVEGPKRRRGGDYPGRSHGGID